MMECELPEFYHWTEPIARKNHNCCECNAPITKGEKHFAVTGKWHGEIISHRQHLICEEACEFIRDNLNGGDCICFGGLMDFYHESSWQASKTHAIWKEFRDKMAAIKRRERRPHER